MILNSLTDSNQPETVFLGLAPFLRMSIAGADLKPAADAMLSSVQARPQDANLWMNLSIVMQCLGQKELGLHMQAQALSLQRIYRLPASNQPVRLRLLMLMVPGDLGANTPLDCLLENSDIDLVFYYLTPGNPLAVPVPEHDVMMLALSECEANREMLLWLERSLMEWTKPMINAPRHIPNVDRAVASELLQDVPGLLMPVTLRVSRAELQALVSDGESLSKAVGFDDYPIIVRPLGSQGGHDLAKINHPQDMADYLGRVLEQDFFVAPFVDYSGRDGFFRKMRVALIGGEPYACHMAVSSDWMIHYVNAGMYDEAWKREEELAFMTHFDDFARRHRSALAAIANRTQLDYVCIDCGQTRDGALLVFEIDHTGVVHAMDTQEQFPYKQIYMQKVKDAFCNLLASRTCSHSTPTVDLATLTDL